MSYSESSRNFVIDFLNENWMEYNIPEFVSKENLSTRNLLIEKVNNFTNERYITTEIGALTSDYFVSNELEDEIIRFLKRFVYVIEKNSCKFLIIIDSFSFGLTRFDELYLSPFYPLFVKYKLKKIK